MSHASIGELCCRAPKKSGWFKRLGLVGFTFFLVKGIIWLAVLAGIWSLH